MPKGITTRPSGQLPSAHAALNRLLLPPMPAQPLVPDSPADQLLALMGRLDEIAAPKVYSPYSTDFYRFLMELVWTKDEARGGKVAQFPHYAFLKDLCDDLVVEEKYFIEKSRRVLATWTACAFDIWIAAGGQDPRWPALLNARGNRQVFLCHQNFEDANKCLYTRTFFIIQQLEQRGIRAKWPDWPQWTWKEGEISGTNGSLINAVPEGSNQLRGPGATLLHIEELAFLNNAKAMIEGALPVLRGGGHIVAISTANTASYAKLLRNGELRSGW